MNFDFAQQINPELKLLNFKNALDIAENKLIALPESAFHAVLGQSLVSQADDLATWIDVFYTKAAAKISVKALYFEMNEFDINTDEWFIDGFAYEQDGGPDPLDMEWITDWQADTTMETGTIFIIEGYEKLQNAFETIELTTKDLDNARDWCEQIIIARFMELMRAVHLKAEERGLAWAKLPIYFTEHSYDFIVRSVIS
ncbi:MAG TPA: hypothetical protein VNS58_32190 [Puia sp.]|nr:hypothetical protein [Puia sp.]